MVFNLKTLLQFILRDCLYHISLYFKQEQLGHFIQGLLSWQGHWKGRGSSKLLEFIIWEPQMSAQNLKAIHLILICTEEAD